MGGEWWEGMQSGCASSGEQEQMPRACIARGGLHRGRRGRRPGGPSAGGVQTWCGTLAGWWGGVLCFLVVGLGGVVVCKALGAAGVLSPTRFFSSQKQHRSSSTRTNRRNGLGVGRWHVCPRATHPHGLGLSPGPGGPRKKRGQAGGKISQPGKRNGCGVGAW